MDIEKVNELNFLNEEVKEFTSRGSQNLAKARNPSQLKQKFFKCSLKSINRPYIQFLIRPR